MSVQDPGLIGTGTPAGAWLNARRLQPLFGLMLIGRLLYPFFNSPLDHLFSDPLRHWDNGGQFLHPSIMGSIDPFLFQLWIFVLRRIAQGTTPAVLLGCGLLCAAMPYGWYRALRELQTRERALAGALLIGLIPESLSLYGYFMNETLLITLLGFCFWSTLRANRKRTVGAFTLAALAWACAAFTRTIAVPMAIGCLAWLWFTQPQRPVKALAALALGLLFAVPAGLHARAKLGFFAPLGNLYFNEIYSVSGLREINIDYGPDGTYHFGCPSFYNPTFYPFSTWTTNRVGVIFVAINLSGGRDAWIREKERVAGLHTFPVWRRRMEDVVYLLFGQIWPNSDRSTVLGWLTVWSRWIWPVVLLRIVWAACQRRFRGPAIVLPVCALVTVALLALQSEGVMEARFREPIDAILIASLLLIVPRQSARPRTATGEVS
jgi:hypothetical protein